MARGTKPRWTKGRIHIEESQFWTAGVFEIDTAFVPRDGKCGRNEFRHVGNRYEGGKIDKIQWQEKDRVDDDWQKIFVEDLHRGGSERYTMVRIQEDHVRWNTALE